MRAIGHAAKTCQKCGRPFEQGMKTPSNFRKAKFCGMACMHAAKKHTPEKAATVFWSRVQKGDGCWPYLGAKLPEKVGGYGWANYLGKIMGAHRIAWIVTHGPIPPGLEVCHTCDFGPCCNPAHLFLGTHQENMTDCATKGRHTGYLDAPQVREIRKLVGAVPNKEIASQFGVSQGTVSNIKVGRTYKHVKETAE